MKNLNFFGRLQKKNGELIYVKDKYKKEYEEFKKLIDEDSYIELYIETVSMDGSLAQLALAHTLLKQLSLNTGNSVEDLKLYIKNKVGLCINRTLLDKEYLICKSLGDCSKSELILFINETKEMLL